MRDILEHCHPFLSIRFLDKRFEAITVLHWVFNTVYWSFQNVMAVYFGLYLTF
ncbi:MAG: hypothetical protein HC877_06905 [Thioploca sp.]|nr:hypothetical protein [Thioploca sp.]